MHLKYLPNAHLQPQGTIRFLLFTKCNQGTGIYEVNAGAQQLMQRQKCRYSSHIHTIGVKGQCKALDSSVYLSLHTVHFGSVLDQWSWLPPNWFYGIFKVVRKSIPDPHRSFIFRRHFRFKKLFSVHVQSQWRASISFSLWICTFRGADLPRPWQKTYKYAWYHFMFLTRHSLTFWLCTGVKQTVLYIHFGVRGAVRSSRRSTQFLHQAFFNFSLTSLRRWA